MRTGFTYIIMYMLSLLGGATACGDDKPEIMRGLTVAIDNSQCPDIPIGSLRLRVYGAEGKLVASHDYADPQKLAAAVIPLEAGRYTTALVANADEATMTASTLTELIGWIETETARDPDLLSGMEEVEVAAVGITHVRVTLRREIPVLPALRLLIKLPNAQLPDYTPTKAQGRIAEAGYSLRCVAELCEPGTGEAILHKILTPAPLVGGEGYLAELTALPGTYDLRLWTDYAPTDEPLADTYYNTTNLRMIHIQTEPYRANTDAKDAAYHTATGITLAGEEDTDVEARMVRPLAKYRLVATDVEAYGKLTAEDPKKYPPLEELTVTVRYENFFPASFNAATGKPNDSYTGIAYAGGLTEAEGIAPDTTRLAGSDWILTNGAESFVSVTLRIDSREGNTVNTIAGVHIPYRRGQLTTVKGNFLSGGLSEGGVQIDTEWEGDIVVPF